MRFQPRSQAILFIWLLCALILSGCDALLPTPQSIPPTPLPSPPWRQPPTATPTATPELEPMIITLELWLPEDVQPYGDRPGAALLAQQLDDFGDAYPDVQVEVTVKKAHGRGGLLDFLRTAREAAPSVLPDLVVLDAPELETAAGSGLIHPLDDLLSPAEMADRFPFAVTLGTVNDQTFGFTIGADMQHLAYRPALLASPPVSWTHIISPPVPFLFPAGGRDQPVNDATLIQYLATGGTLTDQDDKPWLDRNVMVSVFDFYSACVGTGTISPTVVLTITETDQAWERFKAGEGAMTAVRAGRYWLEADETMAAAPLPTSTGQPLTIARGWVIAMVADDPVRQSLAMLLLDWLIAPDHNGLWTQAAGYLPGTHGALRMWNVSTVDQATLRSILEAAIPPPRPEAMATAGTGLQQGLEALLRRRATPEDAAAAALANLGR